MKAFSVKAFLDNVVLQRFVEWAAVVFLFFFRSNSFEQSFTPTMPISVDSVVATRAGKRKSVGLAEPTVARKPITVVGSSCKLVADITVSIIISVEAVRSPLSISFIAFIAIGVAALPSPKRLAEKFIVIYFRVCSSLDGNSRLVMGRSSFSSMRDKPSRSTSEKNPSQNPYKATRLRDSSTALFAPEIIAFTALVGLVNRDIDNAATSIKNQIIVIAYCMRKVWNIAL